MDPNTPQKIALRYATGGRANDLLNVAPGASWTLGRDPGCEVRYDPDRDDQVSRRHARLRVVESEPPAVEIEDLGSRNGLYVNNQRIASTARLREGDRIQLGTGGPEFSFAFDPPLAPPVMETRFVPAMKPAGPTVVAAPPKPAPQPPSVPAAAPAVAAKMPPKAPVAAPAANRGLLAAGIALLTIGAGTAGYSLLSGAAGQLSTKVYHQRAVLTGAYKTYGNPSAVGGKYWFAKVVLDNSGQAPLRDIRVSYQIPEYISWTTPDETPELLPGQTAVFPFYPKFPARVTNIQTRTPSVLEIKIDYDTDKGRQTRIEKREFEFRGLTEFVYTDLPSDEIVSWWDAYDNDPLLAAWVHDEDPAVKTFYGKVSGESGGVNVISGQKELYLLGRGIYDYMVRLGMTYSGAKGVPDNIGDVKSFMQSIRTPRDVIYGNSGLCVELALLWASLGQAAGAKTYLVLVPGHAFTILQADDGSRIVVETTAIGGASGGNMAPAATFDEAIKMGAETFKQSQQKGLLNILDVRDLQAKGIRPPELPDINKAELVKMLDDQIVKRQAAAAAAAQRPVAD